MTIFLNPYKVKNISIELTKTCLFWSFWSHLNRKNSFESVIISNFSLWPLIIRIVYHDFIASKFSISNIFFPAMIVILGPIYSNLTSSFSSDTILNLAVVCLSIRIIFYDFYLGSFTAISLNSALFGAIILSSRLDTSFSAAILVASALCIFRHTCQLSNRAVTYVYISQLAQTVFNGEFKTSIFSVLFQFIFCILGPYLICHPMFLKNKNRIYGIWDEAEIRI